MSAAGVFVVTLAVLWWNAAPGVSFHDSGEFAMAAASAGIPHPPGAPTWTMLASSFVRLGGFHDPARGTNLFSGLWGAITLGLLCWLAQMWTIRIFPNLPRWAHPAAGISAVLVMLHSSGFLEQSFITEQYTLMTALFIAALIVATEIISDTNTPARTVRLCTGFGLIWGLAIGNHPSQLLLVLLAAWAIWIARKNGGPARMVGACAAGLFTGLLVFLWVPIRSHANPIMDWGNVKTLDRFIWAITRQQWELRPISEAPRNLVPEWIASYDLLRQLGVAGLALTAVGVAALVKRQHTLLGWLAVLSVTYGAGMLYGHLRQKSIHLEYISSYGVVDWHLPIYLACALAAAIGLAWIVSRFRSLPTVVLLAALAWGAYSSVSHNSLRRYTAPDQFISDLLTPLPADSLIVASGDNLAFMMGYHSYIQRPKGAPWVLVHSLSMEAVMARAPDPKTAKMVFVAGMVVDKDRQPFRVSVPSHIGNRPLRVFGDYFYEESSDYAYMLPDGLLFEFTGRKVTNKEVLAAENEWRAQYPKLLREPGPDAKRLERDAYSRLYAARGMYFAMRKMWSQAAESYRLSLEWVEANGGMWVCLGDSLDRMGKTNDAVEAYKRAMWYLPTYPEPKYSLAMVYARSGYFPAAETLLVEALRETPNDKQTQQKLKEVRSKMKSGGR